MSHWAEIDNNNIVLRVVVCDNNDPNGDEGYQWLLKTYGGTWIKTSYNGNIRKNFAGVGLFYDEEKDAFYYLESPFKGWVLNENTCRWEAPVPYPDDSNYYDWNEETLSWEIIDIKVI